MPEKLFVYSSFLIFSLIVKPLHAHPGHSESLSGNGTNGAVQPYVSISEENGKRVIKSNGIPNHGTGRFPNPGNPNMISPQSYKFEVPLHPRENAAFTSTSRQPTGVAVNGVVFDPATAEFWKNDPNSGWNLEAIGGPRNLGLDQNLAHVQPSGAYHYHGVPDALITDKGMTLLGWAADGFPIYGPLAYDKPNDPQSALRAMKPSYRLKTGQRTGGSKGPGGAYDGSYTEDFVFVAGSGDLDEANGRHGVTPEYPSGTYYYVATETFPFLPRKFKGTPDPSFARMRGDPQGQNPVRTGSRGGRQQQGERQRPPFPPDGRQQHPPPPDF